jgi:hypothetical protein
MTPDVLTTSYLILIADAVGDGDTDLLAVVVLDEDDEGDWDAVVDIDGVLDWLAPDDRDDVTDSESDGLTDTVTDADPDFELVADTDELGMRDSVIVMEAVPLIVGDTDSERDSVTDGEAVMLVV